MGCFHAQEIQRMVFSKFNPQEYSVVDNRLQYPSAEELSSTDFRSSRGGSFGNAAKRTRSAIEIGGFQSTAISVEGSE